MESSFLRELMLILLSAIKLLSSYPIPEQLPVVHIVPHAVLEEKICHKPCSSPVLGWFSRHNNQIYLDNHLDLKGSIYARSILLHELVHYVQELSGRFASMRECESWVLREREAYTIQNRWLFEQGSPTMSLVLLNVDICPDSQEKVLITSNQKGTLAVFDFKLDIERANVSVPDDQLLAKRASDQFRVEMSKAGTYELIKQDLVDQTMQAIKAQELPCTRNDCALEIGKTLHADQVITGKITKSSAIISYVSIQLIDIKAGLILRNETLELKGNFPDLISGGMAALARRVTHVE